MADISVEVHPLAKNFLGKDMYVIVTRPVRSPEIEKRLGEPLEHMVELEK